MSNLIPATPAEGLRISPEGLTIANTYLQCQDINKTAEELDITPDEVSHYLAKREIKAYIDHVFMDYGFNNRFRLRNIMDNVINKKLEEMEEADVGSSKDIADILALSHKMSMELLDKQIKLIEAQNKHPNVKNQTNVQINDTGGTNYQSLLDKLVNKNKNNV